MTGEVTLRGRVLPIGGLREKTMAAYRARMKTVIVPAENEPDISEIDKAVAEKLHFVYAENMDDVLENALGLRVCPQGKGEKAAQAPLPCPPSEQPGQPLQAKQ